MSGKIVGLLAVVLGALTAMGIGLVTAQNSGVEVRVEARRLADGRIEFAVAQRVNGQWSERILPSSRYFPTSSEGRWLRSSPVTVGQHLSAPTAEPPTIREWRHFEFEDVGGRNSGYHVSSTDDRGRTEAALYMRCGPATPHVFIGTGHTHMGDPANSEVAVAWRFTEDSSPTRELWWSDGETSSVIAPPARGAFVRALRNADGRLFIAVTDTSNETVTYEFNVAGAADVAATLGCLG